MQQRILEQLLVVFRDKNFPFFYVVYTLRNKFTGAHHHNLFLYNPF